MLPSILMFQSGARKLSRTLPTLLCALLPALIATTSALHLHRHHDFRETRYFAYEMILAPLENPASFDSHLSFPTSDRFVNALPVLCTNDPKHVSRWLGDHVPASGCCYLGFDVESVPNAPWMTRKASFRGPATVQLATPYASLVVHLARGNGNPSRSCRRILQAVLRDPRIVKAGCSIDQDMLELAGKWRGLEARSRFDLGGVGASGKERKGLKTLAKEILGVALPKSKRIAMSDWSQVPLSQEQIAYAARDAWVAAAISEALSEYDADTFGAKILVDRLQSQRSLKDLSTRLWKRKQAKAMIATLLMPYDMGSVSTVHESTSLSSWKLNAVRELKKVLHENQAEQCEIFNLGLVGRRSNLLTFNNTEDEA